LGGKEVTPRGRKKAGKLADNQGQTSEATEINWREKFSQMISPAGVPPPSFFEHSSSDSEQVSFPVSDPKAEERIQKLPAVNRAIKAICTMFFLCISGGFII
jgi:hypothetical protein